MSRNKFYMIEDLSRHRCFLNVWRLKCGHKANIPYEILSYPAARAERRCNLQSPRSIGALVDRMRCSRCRSRKVDYCPKNRD